MANIQLIRTSSSSGPAALATVQAQRSSSSMTFVVDTVSNFNTGGFIATAGTPKNIALASGENLLVLENPMVFRGHIDSGDIIIDSVVSGYTDNGNDIGDVIIVKPTTEWGNEVADVLAVSHDDNGTLNSAAISQIETDLTGKSIRLKARTLVSTSTSTLTPDIDSYNCYELNAQAANLTIGAPTGTPNDFDVLIIRIKPTGGDRTLTLNGAFVNVSGLDTPSTLTSGKWCYIGSVWNDGTSKWDIISITQEA